MSSLDRVVLDTNVLSYFLRESLIGAQYKRLVAGQVMCVACVTPEELYYGAERCKWGPRRRRSLEAVFADCVLLPVSFEIAKVSARLRAERARVGRPIERADAWIAASALGLDLPLVTHDHDFYGIDGLRLVTLLDRHPVDSHCTSPTTEDEKASLKAASIVSPPRLLQ